MKGFEIKHKSNTIYASVEKGAASVIINSIINDNSSLKISVSGLNTLKENENEYIDWYDSDLEMGDEIIIKIIEVAHNTEPINIRKRDK